MERKKIRSECEFTGLKHNRLNYKCKEYNETSSKSVNDLIEKFPRIYKFYKEKVFILMSIGIAGKNVMKHYRPKYLFIVN